VVARVRGDDTPSEPESLGGDDKEEDEGKEEGEVTSHPHSPPLEDLPSLGDFFSRQAGFFFGVRRPNWPWMEIEPMTGPLPSRGGKQDGHTSGEILLTHIYRKEEE
jgi:hypothetical protein